MNRVMDSSRATVRNQLSEAVVSYEEKPRDQWIFDFPAQVALCGTQIWWTTEVGISFARLEEGYENALKDYYKKQVHNHIEVRLIFCDSLIQANLGWEVKFQPSPQVSLFSLSLGFLWDSFLKNKLASPSLSATTGNPRKKFKFLEIPAKEAS